MALSDIFATGNVNGGNQTGGLIGTLVSTGGILYNAYATGSVSGNIAVGGLIGFFGVCTSCGNFTSAGINEAYANGSVSGTSELTDISHQNIPESTFAPPSGYTKQEMPFGGRRGGF